MRTSQIKIEYGTYEIFYDKMIDGIVTQVPEFIYLKESPKLWQKTIDGRNIATEITKGRVTAWDHFYKKLTTGKSGSTQIDCEAFCNAIFYFKILDSPLNDGWDKMEPEQKADVLLARFENTYKTKKKEKSDEEIASDCRSVETLVEKFYINISQKKLREAWNQLAPAFQGRRIWDGSFERFERGYNNTIGLKNIHAFNARFVNPEQIDCLVFYDDEIDLYLLPELTVFPTLTVKGMNTLTEKTAQLKDKIESLGGSNFENVPVGKLFDPTAIEYIWYTCGVSPDELGKRLGYPQRGYVKRLYDCSCIFTGRDWLINDISYRPMEIRSAR